jgi:predicted amidophosphoribosyltransferase
MVSKNPEAGLEGFKTILVISTGKLVAPTEFINGLCSECLKPLGRYPLKDAWFCSSCGRLFSGDGLREGYYAVVGTHWAWVWEQHGRI